MTASRAPDNVLTVYYYDDFGALYALERGGVRYYVGSDHLGTPKVVTDNTGAIVRQMEYDVTPSNATVCATTWADWQASAIVGVLGEIVLFGKRFGRIRLVGAAMIAVGVVCIKLG